MRGTVATAALQVTYTGAIAGGDGTMAVNQQTAPAGAGSGALAVDYGPYLAAIVRDRKTGANVFLDGGLVEGTFGAVTTTVSLDQPVKAATFNVADRRVARFADVSYTDGDKACTIDHLAGPSEDIRTWSAFIGRTEPGANGNEGPYRPRQAFGCVSYAADWSTRPGCIRSTGWQGHKRGWYVRQHALSAGISMPASVENLGRVVQRPIDYTGTTLDLIKRWGELEGWWPKVDDETNSLDIISDRYVFQGEPVFAFDDSNILGPGPIDQPPVNPPTAYVLSGAKMTDESAGDAQQVTVVLPQPGIDANGDPTNTIITTVTERGVVVFQSTESWECFSPDGVALGQFDFRLRRRTDVESVWERAAPLPDEAVGRLTTQLKRRTQRDYDTTGVPLKTGATGGHVWTIGGTFDRTQAELIQVQEIVWEDVWNTDLAGVANCSLKSQSQTTQQYYSPLKPQVDGGVAYGDGSFRADDAYSFRVVDLMEENWSDYRFVGATNPEVDVARRISMYAVTGIDTGTGQKTEGFVNAQSEFEKWVGNGSNSHYVHSKQVHSNAIASPSQSQGNQFLQAGRLLANSRDEQDGPVPGPPTGSANVPQFTQQPFQASFYLDLPYVDNKVTEFIEAAEDVDELRNVALRRTKIALSNMVTITHRHLPYLQPGDPVTVTSGCRNMFAKRGYVAQVDTSVDLKSGEGAQTTIVMVLNDWPVYPELVAVVN